MLLRVRLIKKFALVLNDIDLTEREVGDVFDCDKDEARMLILEGWAEFVDAAPSDVLDNEGPSASVWQIIESHRDGRKDKLA